MYNASINMNIFFIFILLDLSLGFFLYVFCVEIIIKNIIILLIMKATRKNENKN